MIVLADARLHLVLKCQPESFYSSVAQWLERSTANPLAFKDVGWNPTPGTQLVRAHGMLNGGGLYPVFYVGATERPWTSLNE